LARLLDFRLGGVGALAAAAALFLAVAAFEPFNNEQNFSAEDPSQVVPGHLDLGQRLGYAILVGGGIATVNMEKAPSDAETGLPQTQPVRDWTSSSNLTISQSFLDCAGNVATSANEPIDIKALTASIVAAETFNRGELHRRLEFLIGHAVSSLTGEVPDLSYGLPQIRLSLARDALRAQGFSDSLSATDVLNILESNCTAISISTHLIIQILDNIEKREPKQNIDEMITKVALSYNGADTLTNSSFLYSEAVKGAYHLLTHDTSLEAAEDTAEPEQGLIRFCVYFDRAMRAGDTQIADAMQHAMVSGDSVPPSDQAPPPPPLPPAMGAQALVPPTETSTVPPQPIVMPANPHVMISLWSEERSPKAFSDELSQARAAWIVDQFKGGFKLTDDRITVRYLSSRRGKGLVCPEEVPARASVAYIKISPDRRVPQ
jgi:hypothetical protein